MLQQILKEVRLKADQVKNEVVTDILKSKTLNKIVSNNNFIKALSYVIETKQEVQDSIGQQFKSLFKSMNLPNKKDLAEIAKKLDEMEKSVEKFAARNLAIKSLAKKKSPAKKSGPRKSKGKKKSRR